MAIRNIIIILFIINLFLGLFAYVVSKKAKYLENTAYWTAGNFLIALAYLLMGLRSFVPDLLSIFLVNAAFVFAGLIRVFGFLKLFNKTIQKKQYYNIGILLSVFLILVAWFTFVRNDFYIRTVICNSVFSLMAIIAGAVVLLNKSKKEKFISVFTSAPFFLFAVITGAKIMEWIYVPASRELFDSSFLNYMRLIASMLMDITWTILFLMLTVQRSNDKQAKSEENLKEAQKIGNVGHWEYAVAENKLYLSEQSCRIFEILIDQCETTMEKLIQFFHPEDQLTFKEELSKTDKDPSPEITFRILMHDGKLKYITQRISTRYDEAGKPLSILGSIHDITRLKLAELTLIQQKAQLLELNASKDKFFSIISHDVKNPLNMILGFSELLLTNIDTIEKKELRLYAEKIYRGSKSTTALLLNLLDWARSQQNEIVLNQVKINLTSVILECVDLLQNQAREKGIKMENHVSNEITINADIDMVKSVFQNLITNAIKFTGSGGKITFHAEYEVGKVLISVSDNGIGMDEKTRKSMFKIGETILSKGTNGEHGTGLGLILCKEFIEKHDGTIRVESEEGLGSSFMFTLPIYQIND